MLNWGEIMFDARLRTINKVPKLLLIRDQNPRTLNPNLVSLDEDRGHTSATATTLPIIPLDEEKNIAGN